MCVFHVSWELPHFAIQHVGYFVIFWVSRHGSFHSKMTCLLELSTGKLQKCKKRCAFVAKSLQTVELPTGSSKYVKNRVLFKKHRILRNKIKPHVFCHFLWSSNVNLTFFLELDSDLHKSMGAFNWEFKTMELRARNAQLWGGAKMIQRISDFFDKLNASYGCMMFKHRPPWITWAHIRINYGGVIQ